MPTWIAPGSGTWTDPANWSGGVPNAVGADATFFLGAESVVSLPASTFVTLGSLNMTLSNGISFFINGLNSGTTERLIFNNGVNPAQVNATGLGSFGFLPTGGLEVELAGNTVFDISLADGFKFEIAAPLSGSGALIKTGAGRLFLNNASTHTGGIQHQGGLIDILGDGSLGSGAVTISNGGELLARSTMTIDNTIGTLAGAVGAAGNATIRSANGATLTLAGTLSHQSSGTLTFGATGVLQIVIADFGSIQSNGSSTSFQIINTTLQLADAFNAASLFNHAGTGTTRLGIGGVLDTNGLPTIITTLDMAGGTIRSTSGALDLTVNQRNIGLGSQTGTIQGTAGQDRMIVNVEGSYSYSSVVFNNWTAGIDTIQINGNDNGNQIRGTAQNEVINGNGGQDSITLNGGIDTVNAGDEADFIFVDRRSSGSSIDGGAGVDVLFVDNPSGDNVPLSLTSLTGIELIQLRGGSFARPTGLAITDTVFATIQAQGVQYAGTAELIVNMTAPSLLVTTRLLVSGGFVQLVLNGTSGDDVIKPDPFDAGGTEFTINGHDGNDQIDGTLDRDKLNGGDGDDTLAGGENDDTLNGGGGSDQLFGGAGNDILIADADDLVIDGGLDIDTLRIEASGNMLATLSGLEAIELVGGVSLTLTAAQFNTGFFNATAQIGLATVSGTGALVFNMDPDPVTAQLYLTSLSFAPGANVSVTINGTSGLDALKGAPSVSNTINAGNGADQIRGGNQADTINGGTGDDKIFAWGGADVLTGGTGSDQFRYFFSTDSGTGAAADRITDFEIGIDRFNFVIMDADANTAGDQAFAFLGNGAFTAPGTGQIRFQNSGADLLVQVDVDGNGTVDMEMILQGLFGSNLTSTSFML